MPYSRHAFSVGSLFLDTHADQLEENIATHLHGTQTTPVDVHTGLKGLLYGTIRYIDGGSIVAGSHFAVTMTGCSQVTITFSKAFAEFPALAVTPDLFNDATAVYADYVTITFSQAVVRCFSGSSTAFGDRFRFIAIGRTPGGI